MDFQCGRYHLDRTFLKSSESTTARCLNGRSRIKNQDRCCPGKIEFAAKFVNNKLEVFENQFLDFNPHAAWCPFFATNANLEKLPRSKGNVSWLVSENASSKDFDSADQDTETETKSDGLDDHSNRLTALLDDWLAKNDFLGVNMKSNFDSLEFLGAKYRKVENNSLEHGLDFWHLRCKNHRSWKENDQTCDAFLIFEVMENLVLQLGTTQFSCHSDSCEYFCTNSTLTGFLRKCKSNDSAKEMDKSDTSTDFKSTSELSAGFEGDWSFVSNNSYLKLNFEPEYLELIREQKRLKKKRKKFDLKRKRIDCAFPSDSTDSPSQLNKVTKLKHQVPQIRPAGQPLDYDTILID